MISAPSPTKSTGPIARIVLNDPGRANSQTSEMVHAFDDALTLADRDYTVKVVVIKANGKGFCAGHAAGGGYQYPEFAENLEHWESVWKAQSDLFLWPTLRLWEFRKPTIAQVHGYALGGGTYWALLPDLTIASDDAYFQMPLVQGLGFPGGETMIEPWVFMNWKRTYEYLYTAQTIAAAEALDTGHGQPRRTTRANSTPPSRNSPRTSRARHCRRSWRPSSWSSARGNSWACAYTCRCRPM